MDLVMKAIGLVQDVEDDDSPNGSFHVILSAPTLDRDGEVIDALAFEPVPDHITFDIDHDMKVLTTVGSGTPFYAEDGTLQVKGTYASTNVAQQVRTLVREGHIRTTSVTFMSGKRVKDEKGVDHVVKAELLNGTFTPVPSNREAVVLSAKALSAAVDEKVGARNSTKDAESIQGVHDAAVGLGAACAAKSYGGKSTDTLDRPTLDDLREVMQGLIGLDLAELPQPVADVLNALFLAVPPADEPIAVMNPATEDEEPEAADLAAEVAADEAATSAAKSAATPPEVLARLAITENAARLAFGA